MLKLTSNQKVKILQTVAYLTALGTLIFFWDLTLFLTALGLGWVFWLIGINAGLHKYSSHRAFEPKNKLYKLLILFISSLCSLGSNVAWACTHRKHHQYTDQEGDPHSPNLDGGGFWRSLKLWFYYFPTYHINPRTVKDLTVDKEHKWFHNNYYKVIIAYVLILALINPVLVGYLWALPAVYVFTGISYITVLAHNTKLGKLIGRRRYKTSELTFDSKLMSLLLPGEGNHNTHHALPGAARNALNKGDWDLGFWFIRLVGRVPNQPKLEQHFYV